MIVENALAAVYARIVGEDRYRAYPATAAYGTIASSPGRIEMIVAAAEADWEHITDPLLSDTRALLRQVGKLAGRRNDIAHGTVILRGGWGHYLIPPDYNPRKRHPARELIPEEALDAFGNLKYAYAAAQIDTYAGHFVDYGAKIGQLIPCLIRERAQMAGLHERVQEQAQGTASRQQQTPAASYGRKAPNYWAFDGAVWSERLFA